MPENKTKREYYDVLAFVKLQPQKIGYAYKTKNGNLAVRADKIMDEAPLGRYFIKGLCIQLKNKQQAGKYQGATVGVYIDGKRQNIGRVIKIDNGKIFIQAIAAMNSKKLGQFLKNGLYIQKQKTEENQSFADALDKEPLTQPADLSGRFKTSTNKHSPAVNYRP